MPQQLEAEYDPDLDYEPMTAAGPEGPEIDPAAVQHMVDVLRTRQHLAMAIIGGLFGAAFGAVAWLAMSALFGVQVGWMAVVAGAAVGVLARACGHGIDFSYAVAGTILAAISIAFGTLLSGCALEVQATRGADFVELISTMDPMHAAKIFRATFDPLDLLFDGLGLGTAFVMSRRRVKAREMMALATNQQAAAKQQQQQQSKAA